MFCGAIGIDLCSAGASVSGLESLLRAKVYFVEDKGELERFVTSPKVSVYYYATTPDDTTLLPYFTQLEGIKFECVSTLDTGREYQRHRLPKKHQKDSQETAHESVFLYREPWRLGSIAGCSHTLKG